MTLRPAEALGREARYAGPPVATDRHAVTVLANVASAVEVRAALQAGAEGIGLVRTELLLLDADGWPTEAAHRRALRTVLAPLAGRVATVRVLEYGADKLPPSFATPACAASLSSCDHPNTLEAQLAAILAEGAACDRASCCQLSTTPARSTRLAAPRTRPRATAGVLGDPHGERVDMMARARPSRRRECPWSAGVHLPSPEGVPPSAKGR